MKTWRNEPKGATAMVVVSTALLFSVTVSVAQMRPGAKVEKTYGRGLPRDMDKLLIDDHEYPDYPLKPNQEAYKDVDGYRIKDFIKKITAISLKSLVLLGHKRTFSCRIVSWDRTSPRQAHRRDASRHISTAWRAPRGMKTGTRL
jgi:hypothetical protein